MIHRFCITIQIRPNWGLSTLLEPEGGHWDKMSDSEVIENHGVRMLQSFIFLEEGRGGGGGVKLN
jgi:hypothetical protein